MIIGSRSPGSNPAGDRATGCRLRGDRAPRAVFGPFPSGRVGGRQLRFLLGPGGWASISFFVRAGWVGVEILSTKTGWAWVGARARPALSVVLSMARMMLEKQQQQQQQNDIGIGIGNHFT